MTLQLTQSQKDILFGTLLGDGNLQTGSKGKTWRYRALHEKRAEEYIKLKYSTLQNLCGTGIISSSITDKRTGKVSERLYFNTLVHECLKPYGEMFYTFDKTRNRFIKDVPLNIKDHLTPAALAFLYQDDGAVKDKDQTTAMRICTESFSKAGVERIIDALKDLYDIETSLAPKYSTSNVKEIVGYRIYVPVASAEKFCNLVRPYVVQSMEYKLTC